MVFSCQIIDVIVEVGMKVHCNLSTIMGSRRCSIEEVHQKTGLARKTISNLYNDRATRIDFETLAKLCAALNCGIEELLVIEDSDIAINKENNKGGKSNE